MELDKSYQKADWSVRPLTPGMIAYAAEDTSLLIPLHDQLVAELAAKGRLAWVEEECAALTRVRHAVREEDEAMFLRFKGAHLLDPRTLAVLERLLSYRDGRARERDVPSFKVLGNDHVRDIALKKPVTKQELAETPGLPAKVAQRHQEGILHAVREALAIPEKDLQRYPSAPRVKRDPEKEGVMKRLKQWRQGKAEQLGMEPGILANNTLLEEFADLKPGQGIEMVKRLRGWQKELFGDEILRVLLR